MDHPDKSFAPNQVAQQIIIPFILVFAFIIYIGYLVLFQRFEEASKIELMANISLILLFIPLMFFLLLDLLLLLIFTLIIMNASKPLTKIFVSLKIKFSHYYQVINKASNLVLSPLVNIESFFSLFKLNRPKSQ